MNWLQTSDMMGVVIRQQQMPECQTVFGLRASTKSNRHERLSRKILWPNPCQKFHDDQKETLVRDKKKPWKASHSKQTSQVRQRLLISSIALLTPLTP